MKIKFKVIAVGESFQIDGKLHRKEALSLAQDENRVGHLVMAERSNERQRKARFEMLETQRPRIVPDFSSRAGP